MAVDVQRLAESALQEDLGTETISSASDLTTAFLVDPGVTASARIIARQKGVVAGLEVARAVFHCLDPAVEMDAAVADGAEVMPDQLIMHLSGSAAALLTGERTALNFLQRLSGIATVTRAFVDRVAGTGARVTDTRKTTPGLRSLEKRAVLCGGGVSHRTGLYDAVLIKENHAAMVGGVAAAFEKARRVAVASGHGDVRLMVEAETVQEVQLLMAAEVRPHRILLDNMPLEEMREAVRVARDADPTVEVEATGGITLETVRAIAETGVDVISIGALTHSAPALDLSLLFAGSADG